MNRLAAVLLTGTLLSGCAPTFNQPVGYDTKTYDARGTITVSDPKLYSREALIEERRDDIAWINDLLKESTDKTKVKFVPEIVREVEKVTAFAAAVGLNFDPAAGLDYSRDKETGDIQQEIDTLKLQLQLDQLTRDAELVRAQFAAQTEAANTDLGLLGEGGVADATGTSATSADQLKAAVDSLKTSLTAAMVAEGKLPTPVTYATNPGDDFRDRSAYRDLLKSARNSASLDELHDLNGAKLIRLNFQATVIPHPKYRSPLGAIEMRISAPEQSELAAFYKNWIVHVNISNNFRSTSGRLVNSDIKNDLLNRPYLKARKIGSFDYIFPTEFIDSLAMLAIQDVGIVAAGTYTSRQLKAQAELKSLPLDERKQYLSRICPGSTVIPADSEEATLRDTLNYHRALKGSPWSIKLVSDHLYRFSRANGAYDKFVTNLQNLQILSDMVVAAGRKDGIKSCSSKFFAPLVVDFSTPSLEELFGSGSLPKARVYEIGPREQIQQISTVARSANSLALAASIAASAPSSGLSGDAAASYSQQAVGRAAALERVPSVVGYSVFGTENDTDRAEATFGWVIAPKAVLNPEGSIDMQHIPKTYDLSVDLSVPAWWPLLSLDVRSAWGPSPTSLAQGAILASDDDTGRVTTVPLNRAETSYASFTEAMTQTASLRPVISNYFGGPINACSETSIVIEGRNLWRTKQAIVLGKVIPTKDISVLPDMNGIVLKIPKFAPSPATEADPSPKIYLLTPTGSTSTDQIDTSTARNATKQEIVYQAKPSGDACKGPKNETPKDPNAAAIKRLDDGAAVRARRIPAPLTFVAHGVNLGKISSVTLGGVSGTLTKSPGGKKVTATFDVETTKGIQPGRNVQLIFRTDDDKTHPFSVEIQSPETKGG
jgi:hypothetical protein